jgi:hypothetical protein
MDKTERDALRRVVDDFSQWERRATEVRSWRDHVRTVAKRDERDLESRRVEIARAGQPAWQVIPLEENDTSVVVHLAECANLAALTNDDRALLRLLTEDAPRAATDARRLLGMRRFFSGSAKKQAATTAADFLRSQHEMIVGSDVPARLERLGAFTSQVDVTQPRLEALLDPVLRLDLLSERNGQEILKTQDFDGLPEALTAIARVVANEGAYQSAARDAGEQVRHAEVRRVLGEMPVDSLKTATRDRLRLGPLTDAGITTVQQVLERGMRLVEHPRCRTRAPADHLRRDAGPDRHQQPPTGGD